MPIVLKRLLLMLAFLVPCAFAQTRNYPADVYGGALSISCTWPPASKIAITSISRTAGSVVTVTVSSTAGIGPVGGPNTRPIYITGVTDVSFNSNLANPAFNATIASATTLTFTGSGGAASSSGGFVVPANFYTQQIGQQLWECTPAGHGIFLQALGILVPPGVSTGQNAPLSAIFASKYGSSLPASVAGTYNLDTQLGNFNAIGDNSTGSQLPSKGACGGACQQLPEIDSDKSDIYATNPANIGAPGTINPMLDAGQAYNAPNTHVTTGISTVVYDAFSPAITSFFNWYLLNFSSYNGKNTTAYEVFSGIGSIDERSPGTGAGPDFITPGNPGANDNDLAAMLFQTSPMQTYTPSADRGHNAIVYPDPLIYSKSLMASPPATCGITRGNECSFPTYLQKKYGTIGALNTAWGMSGFTYSTFGSSGLCIGYTYVWCNTTAATETWGTGNGATTTFAHTLAHTSPSPNSIEIFVAGTLVAGDCPSGRIAPNYADNSGQSGCPVSAGHTTIAGPTVSSGNCVLATGVCTITFSAAPANGAAITVKYVNAGWGAGGTGIMDEDGLHIPWGANRNTICILPVANPTSYVPGSQSAACWNGNGTYVAPTWNSTAATDLTNWDTEFIAEYEDRINAAFKAVTPNLQLATPQFFANWGAPAPNYYLRGLQNFVDVVWLNVLFNNPTQSVGNAMISYITAATTLPLLNSTYLVACADSAAGVASSAGPPPTCAGTSTGVTSTQPARAALLNNVVTSELGSIANSSSGLQQFVGYSQWGGQHDCDSPDNPINNWGIMTCHDNAYNGHDAASTAVACTDQPGAATCGNEPAPTIAGATRPFGDFFGGATGATATNLLWTGAPATVFPWSGILASSRAIDWSKAGVTTGANPQTGALPSDSWMQCNTTIAPYTGTAATINNAIAACSGSSQYVLLGPGTFTLSTGITFVNANHVELRGSGSDQTFIQMLSQDACTGINAGICIGNGIAPQFPVAATQPKGTNAADWTGTVEGGAGLYPSNAQGLIVANIGSAGGGIHQNQFITVDQAGSATPAAGISDCTDFSIQSNACIEENASTANRIVPSNALLGVGIPVNVTVSGTGTTVNLVTVPAQPASFSTAWVGMLSTVYLGGPTGTPTSVTIASCASTTVCTLAAPVANGSYSMSLYSPVTGTLTQSTGAFHATTGSIFTSAFVGQVVSLMANNTLFPALIQSVSSTTDLVFAASPVLPASGTYAMKSVYHAQSQMVQVTNLTGTGCTGTSPNIVCTGAGPFTLTVTPGLYGPNWSALKGPGIWFATWPEANFDGVSNLSMDITNSTNAVNGVLFINANNSWVKNYRSINAITSHIEFIGSAHNTVQSCYLYGTRNATTQSYGVEHFNGGDNLIHNCIFQHITAATITGHSPGTVYANNFSIDNYGPSFNSATITATSQSGTTQTYTYTGLTNTNAGNALSNCLNFCVMSIAGTTNGGGAFNHSNLKWASASSGTSGTFTITVPNSATIANASEANAVALAATSVMNASMFTHDPGVNYTLWEGNIIAGMFNDEFHGHANVDTWFRNYITGYESNKSSATIAAKITPQNRYHNFIGNLLGDNQTGYKGLANVIYYLAPENVTQNAQVLADPLVNTTSMFWGNYDTFTGATRFCGPGAPGFSSAPCSSVSEVPTTDTFGYANTVPSSLTLPASFFYAGPPAYNLTPQGTVPFPAIGPDITASATGVGIAIAPDLVVPANTAPANHAWNNAAETCYYNSPIDPAYPLGMDRGVLLFNANNCYANASPVPTASLTPNPLAFGNQLINTTSGVQTATFQNTSSTNVTITGITVTGNFTRSGGTCTNSTVLTAGQQCTIGATFSPNATGPFTGTMSVTSSAVPSPTVANLTGTGTQAAITWSSPQGGTAYNFGNIPVGTSVNSSPSLMLTNTGSGPLTVAVTITGANTAQFSIVSTTCGSTLAAGNNCAYTVKFTATAATTYTASLTETDSNASNSPQSLTMSGSGFIPVVNPVVPWPPIILSP